MPGRLAGKARQGLNTQQLLAVCAALFIMAVTAYGTVHLIEQRYRYSLENSLTTLLETTIEAINLWKNAEYVTARELAQEETVRTATRALLALPHKPEPLLAADAQQRLHSIMKPHLESHRGYFLIAPDNISLASSRNGNVGTLNLLAKYPEILARVWEGETLLTPIQRSDVPLSNDREQRPQRGDETLFVITPIKEDNGSIIALFALRIDPYKTFFSLAEKAWLGESGESYFFDRQGMMLSRSRFEDQLIQIGLLKPGQSSATNIRLVDPGVNLIQLNQRQTLTGDLPLTRMAASAIKGEKNADVAGYRDYRGVPVVGAWEWDRQLGIGLVMEQDVSEAYGLFHFVRLLIYGGGIVAALILFALVWIFVSGKRQLAQLQLRLQSIVETANDGIVVINDEGIIESVNPAMESIFGYTAVEMLGHNVKMLIPEPHHSGHDNYLSRYQQTGETRIIGSRIEVSGRRKDDSIFPMDLSVNRLDIGSGLHFAGVIHDISERKEAELALQEERDFTRDVLDSLTAQIIVLDDKGRIILTNRAWQEFAQLNSIEEVGIGASYMEVVQQESGHDPDEAAEIATKLQEMLSGSLQSFSFEYRHYGPDKKRWLQVRANHFIHQGHSAIVVSHIDITRRKESELQLRTTQQALERSGIGEMWIDSQTGRVVHVNEHTCKFLGYSREEALTLTIPDFDVHYTGEELEALIVSLQERGWGRFETVHLTKQGQRIPVEVTAMSMATDEGREISICFVVDITERKETENAIIKAQEEAISANRAKSTFLATMSHEIRTPLNGVVGTIEMLAHTPLDDAQQDLVATAQDSAILLQGIIDDILDFSKIEAGRLELEQVPIAVEPLVEKLGENLQHIARNRGVELLLYVDPTLPQIKGDPVRLRQILYNIAGNAIKFSSNLPDRDGQVVISVQLESRKNKQATICFTISDNGIGMSPEVQSRLFNAFVQGEGTTTRRFGGTGLGLVITERLVAMMDGSIEIDSTEGVGSTFTINLTLDEVDSLPVATSNLEGIRVILLTQDKAARILTDYLQHAGAEVLSEAADNAVERCRKDCPGNDELVVVIDTRGDRELAATLRKTMRSEIGGVDLRFLLVERGNRRYARPHEDDGMTLDLNAMRRNTLLNAVAALVGRESPEQERVVPIRPAPEILISVEEAREQGRLVLLVDDNATNRKVISQQLHMLGYLAETAADGMEALEKWRKDEYGMLLTDCHMPIMDGYELSETIRSEEPDGVHKPIIAITADALKGTAQRCLASGMDDYLTKPLQLNNLQQAMDKWLPLDSTVKNAGKAKKKPHTKAKAVQQEVVDPRALGDLLGSHEPEFLVEYYTDFLETSTPTVEQIATAFHNGDLSAVGTLAHKLKSAARTVGANNLADCCLALEMAGKAGDANKVGEQMALLPDLFQSVRKWIENYCKSA